ncbi:hypothetical protein DRN67_00375 [Candidatus Micrarchaeota archaeon]|nr:MAG: hypothetical protein DRN67_00375 [Candidatus Micrarchaeota archaeon]
MKVAERKGDGIFIAALLAIVVMGLAVFNFGGIGSKPYSQLSLAMLVAAGGVSYFALRGSEAYGMKPSEGALLSAGVALAGAVIFSVLVLRTTAVLSTLAGALVIACAVPLISILVRTRGSSA